MSLESLSEESETRIVLHRLLHRESIGRSTGQVGCHYRKAEDSPVRRPWRLHHGDAVVTDAVEDQPGKTESLYYPGAGFETVRQ